MLLTHSSFVMYNIVTHFLLSLLIRHPFATESYVPIGVVLDLDSQLGSMADACMSMAISDFYLAHPYYTTRLKLHTRSAKTILGATSAVQYLLKHDEVYGIVGDVEDELFSELGEKFHVPIVSLTARSSRNTNKENSYFVQATLDDVFQIQALAAICQEFEWNDVVFLYEDTYNVKQILLLLIKVFQGVGVRLPNITSISTLISGADLSKKMEKLKKGSSRVFLVHMEPALASRLFDHAKSVGLMSEEFTWIISDSVSNFMNSISRDSMEGFLGIRPFIYPSEKVKEFQERWKRNMYSDKANASKVEVELNIYGLWAYDAITALAIAVEKTAQVYPTSNKDNTNSRISTIGPRLLKELSKTKFQGLTGKFELMQGKLKQSALEIFHIYGSGEKTVGFWMPDRGIHRELSSESEKGLKNIVGPGDFVRRNRCQPIFKTQNLRAGVPWRNDFFEFVNATIDPKTNETHATGFVIDIFRHVLDLLPFKVVYKFQLYNGTGKNTNNWTYDNMLEGIPNQEYDIIVADTTLWAPRAELVDFSEEYTGSEAVIVIKNKKPFDMWIFVKPLNWDLWLAIIIACVFMSIVLRILERTHNQQLGAVSFSPVTFLAFPERNMVSSNWSVLVLVFWVFMAFILMQSYTANLSAILTVDRINFSISDDIRIGYQKISFMKRYLMDSLHIKEQMLIPYDSINEFHDAMSKGSRKGGIDVVIDELPYVKLFLSKYDSQYKIVGQAFRTGGLGFAFPKGSCLVSHFSKAILDVTQGTNMSDIERRNFGPGYSSDNPLSLKISQGAQSLTFHNFAGLFIIVGAVTVFAVLCSETAFGLWLTEKAMHMRTILYFHLWNSRTNLIGHREPIEGHQGRIYEPNHCSPPPEQVIVAFAVREGPTDQPNETSVIVLSEETSQPQPLGD